MTSRACIPAVPTAKNRRLQTRGGPELAAGALDHQVMEQDNRWAGGMPVMARHHRSIGAEKLNFHHVKERIGTLSSVANLLRKCQAVSIANSAVTSVSPP